MLEKTTTLAFVLAMLILPCHAEDAKTPPLPATNAKGAKINLLALIDPKKDAAGGTWSLKDGELMSEGKGHVRVQIPYQPPDEHDLHISLNNSRTADSRWFMRWAAEFFRVPDSR